MTTSVTAASERMERRMIRVSDSMWNALVAYAEPRGLTPSALIRQAVSERYLLTEASDTD